MCFIYMFYEANKDYYYIIMTTVFITLLTTTTLFIETTYCAQ